MQANIASLSFEVMADPLIDEHGCLLKACLMTDTASSASATRFYEIIEHWSVRTFLVEINNINVTTNELMSSVAI